jgi:hypothetical protein
MKHLLNTPAWWVINNMPVSCVSFSMNSLGAYVVHNTDTFLSTTEDECLKLACLQGTATAVVIHTIIIIIKLNSVAVVRK